MNRDVALRELDLSEAFWPAGDHADALTSLRFSDELFVRDDARRGARGTAMPRTTTAPRLAPSVGELEPDLPAVDSVLEKYRLERVIGLGGFAVVYRARHLILDTAVAVKLLRPSVMRRRPGLPSLLCEEARFAARIAHPNVVRIFDVTHTDAVTYVVMELIDGPDLSVMLRRRRRLPTRMVLKILHHVVAGLEAGLHQGLIHRDVKPSNVLLTRSGVTKLVDFGLARSASAAAAEGLAGTVGTVGYMSPEQIDRPGTVDFRTDIYSLGVTAYQALVGELPFAADNPQRCAERTRHEPAPWAHERASDVPEHVGALVNWMMAKDARERPASYRELTSAIEDSISRMRSHPSSEG